MRFHILLFLLCAMSAFGEDPGLVRIGHNWRYYKGTNEPTAVLGEWKERGFNDSNWLVAFSSLSTPAGFPETTVVYDYGPTYTTIYFRRNFVVQESANIAQLTLRIDYDDGFIAYLNGKEIIRRGVPGAPNELLPFNQYATYHLRGPTEEIDVSSAIPLLLKGDNLLAVQLLGSGVIDRTACFVAELVANFTRAPYVQNTTSNSVQIICNTLSNAVMTVQFGLSPEATQNIIMEDRGTNTHVATLTNLTSGSTYSYRVCATLNGKQVCTDWSTFKTFVPSGSATFMVLGDTGWATTGQMLLAPRLVQETPPDFLMHVGDVIYYNYSQSSADFRCFSVYSDFMRRTPVFLALGNHDNYITRTEVLDAFYLPTNNVTGTEHFYSFDQGDAHFVTLWLDLQAAVQYGPGSPEYTWLEQDLAGTTKPWKFLFFHHVLRSSAVHGQDDYNFNGLADRYEVQASIGALASKYGVQIIFNGHDHDYERFTPLNGPISFITGGGGGVLYPVYVYEPTSVFWTSRVHYLKVQVEHSETTVQAIDWQGALFDMIHVRRDFPERKLYSSTYASPVIESIAANDGDGNITGQKFDFAGEPIPSKPGNFTSVGRLFVNNDGQNIYLGIDELAISATNVVYVFIENPNQPGVKSMAGLGNGLVDPEGEGVDGLDFLENLSFTNFAPSVAVILGDEQADGLFRSYARPSETDFGQGAFYLQAGFPEVIGKALQQYNHSPQDAPFLYEQNANFVELAIPYSALGLHPGDTIRIGLIASLGILDATAGTQSLDTGGVCLSLATQNGITWLEPVKVKLDTGPFQLTATKKSDGTIRLSWSTIPGKKYQLQETSDLRVPFHDVMDASFPRTATGYEEVFDLGAPGAEPAKFFRVVEL